MKKNILKLVLPTVVFSIFILAQGCNQSGKHQELAPTEANEHETGDSHDHDSMATDSLTLNNGAKWKADEPTNKNAGALIATGDQFSKSSKRTLDDYHAFGNDITSGINKMIKECTMEGKEDAALHLWFLPLLKQTNALKEATDTTGLGAVTSEMIHRLQMYKNYFE